MKNCIYCDKEKSEKSQGWLEFSYGLHICPDCSRLGQASGDSRFRSLSKVTFKPFQPQAEVER